MDTAWLDWISVGVRLLHVIAGIAWIGASFYFVWLDNNLRPPPQEKLERGVSGDLWAIHGGGIYEVAKYRLAPPRMPEKLHWFKWEAYTTWLSGTLLLFVLYYLQAELYLVGGPWIASPTLAIVASIAFLASALVLYEIALRTSLRDRPLAFAAFVVLLAAGLCWLAPQLFGARAAWLHVGAALATIMAANVFLGIIPNQRKFVDAVARGETPDATMAALAKLRSTHNNYLTLPVVFTMLSNHYPALYGHPYAWALLLSMGAVLAWFRHFFNLRHRGIVAPMIPASAAALMIGIFFIAAMTARSGEIVIDATAAAPEDHDAMAIVSSHCSVCHAASPTQPGFVAPPGGHMFETADQVRTSLAIVRTSVATRYMPLGNITGISEGERALLLAWLDAQDTAQNDVRSSIE